MSIIELELNLERELVESTDNQEISRGRISDVREKYDFRVSAYFTFEKYYRVTNTSSLCHWRKKVSERYAPCIQIENRTRRSFILVARSDFFQVPVTITRYRYATIFDLRSCKFTREMVPWFRSSFDWQSPWIMEQSRVVNSVSRLVRDSFIIYRDAKSKIICKFDVDVCFCVAKRTDTRLRSRGSEIYAWPRSKSTGSHCTKPFGFSARIRIQHLSTRFLRILRFIGSTGTGVDKVDRFSSEKFSIEFSENFISLYFGYL